MRKSDVEIFGAGIFGLSIAFECLRRGASARVIEKRRVGSGASGGFVGALSPHAPDPWNEKKQFQLNSLIESDAFWKNVEACAGENSGYRRIGRLQPLATERAINRAKAYAEKSRENWLGGGSWNLVEAAEFGSWAPHTPTGWLVFDSLSARINPRRSLSALAAAIANLSGEIVEGETNGFGAKSTILATGWEGLADLEEQLGIRIGRGEKGQAALLDHRAENNPQIYADGLHIVPHEDGTVGIGSTSEREFEDAGSTDERLNSLIAAAAQSVPRLRNATVIGKWASVRPRADSRSPLLGRHPKLDSTYVANGGFKIGYGLAPRVAKVMADLVLDGFEGIPESFTLERSAMNSKQAAA